MKKDGPDVEIDAYSFLTTTPNSLVATINHERMPVLLTKEEEFETWLRGSADEAFALARDPFRHGGLLRLLDACRAIDKRK
jgi:putative SOS response-associated peptidase YedK